MKASKQQLIALGYKHPELRKHLRPILASLDKDATGYMRAPKSDEGAYPNEPLVWGDNDAQILGEMLEAKFPFIVTSFLPWPSRSKGVALQHEGSVLPMVSYETGLEYSLILEIEASKNPTVTAMIDFEDNDRRRDEIVWEKTLRIKPVLNREIDVYDRGYAAKAYYPRIAKAVQKLVKEAERYASRNLSV